MSRERMDLCGSWSLNELEHAPESRQALPPEPSGAEWLNTEVPGDIHPTLENAGRIPDPYVGLNARECTWTGTRDWWYQKSFKVPPRLKAEKFELVFDGVDLFADVFFNGHKVGSTANAFRCYRFDVTDHLKPGAENQVDIIIRATTTLMETRDTSKYLACFYTPRVLARKAQCQFSWDWAPHLPGLGLWRGVYLEALNDGRVEDVQVRTRTDGHLRFDIALDQYGKHAADLKNHQLALTVKFGDRVVSRTSQRVAGGKNFIITKVSKPRLWWPNGYGSPDMYTYQIDYKRGGKVVDSRQGTFGIREVELVEEPQPDGTLSFQFKVNGTIVFAQGANWVPADCFPGTVTQRHYERLIRLSREAGFNMLRVWGGGIYEHDWFYDLCDQNGIMIWQDLMFACSDIPDDDPNFCVEVIPEFQDQLKRLRNHPCIAHWCGGNEKTGTFGAMMAYGDRITQVIGRGAVADLVPDLAYTPSSPFSHTDVGNDPDSGDTHGGCWEDAFKDRMANFRKHIDQRRFVFASEFGYHGPPRLETIKKFLGDYPTWPLNEAWEEHIQDNPYSSLEETFAEVQLKAVQDLFYDPQTAGEFVKLAGTFHAELLGAEMAHHRRRFPTCAGGMVWMLNDCWPAASWSIIDYYGFPKAVYYSLKRACAPISVSVRQAGSSLGVFLTSTGRLSKAPCRGDLHLQLQRVTGEVLWEQKVSTRLQENSSQLVATLKRGDLPKDKQGFLRVDWSSPSGDATTTFFPNLWKQIRWPEPGLSIRFGAQRQRGNEYERIATISTKQYARMVCLHSSDTDWFVFSDNYFDLAPGETRKVRICGERPFEASDFELRHWLTPWE